MFQFIAAIIRMVAQVAAAVAKSVMDAFEEAWKAAAASIAAIFALPGRLLGDGGAGSAAPLDNLEMALPDIDRLDRAEELAAGEVKAVDNLMTRSPAQQAQIFASMDKEDRILADLSLLRPDQVDWLNGLHEDQLRIVAEASERRVADALSGKPQSLLATLSVGQEPPTDKTTLAHRLASKRASQLTPTHPPAYGLQ